MAETLTMARIAHKLGLCCSCVFGVFRGQELFTCSIYQYEHCGLLGGFDHVFELLFLDVGLSEFGGNFRHGFEETQQKTTNPARSSTSSSFCIRPAASWPLIASPAVRVTAGASPDARASSGASPRRRRLFRRKGRAFGTDGTRQRNASRSGADERSRHAAQAAGAGRG